MSSYKEARHQIHMAIHGVAWKEKHRWRGEVLRTCPDCRGLGVRGIRAEPCERCEGTGVLPDPRKPSLTLYRCQALGCGTWNSDSRAECRTCRAPRQRGG